MHGVPEWGHWLRARRRVQDHPAGRALPSTEQEPTADLAAFLLGRYADMLDKADGTVPVWAWTNLLAHGSVRELREVAHDTDGGLTTSRRWRSARALLAAEILARTRRDATLRDLQWELLVPLELDLARRRDVWQWSPEQLVHAVRSAMTAYDHTRRA